MSQRMFTHSWNARYVLCSSGSIWILHSTVTADITNCTLAPHATHADMGDSNAWSISCGGRGGRKTEMCMSFMRSTH